MILVPTSWACSVCGLAAYLRTESGMTWWDLDCGCLVDQDRAAGVRS